jgi:hypothetical protein
LALLVGKLILNEAFDPIRSYISNKVITERVKVEHFQGGNKYGTFHAILVKPIENAIRVDIRLFRWITTVVTFYGFEYRGKDSVYMEDLKTTVSLIAPTHEDARKGNWFTI